MWEGYTCEDWGVTKLKKGKVGGGNVIEVRRTQV